MFYINISHAFQVFRVCTELPDLRLKHAFAEGEINEHCKDIAAGNKMFAWNKT